MGPIIADHTVVADFDKIPQEYLDKVKAMWVSVAGESHSLGYRIGCQFLQQQDPRFPVLIRDSGTPDGPPSSALRLSRATWGDVNSGGLKRLVRWLRGRPNWIYSYGEEDWFTNPLAIKRTKASLDRSNAGGLSLAAFGFGWCWDPSWQNDPGGAADPVHQVRWAGSSVGGPQGSLRWGLDAEDSSLTGNSVCLDTYLSATEAYISHCQAKGYPTVVFFTTGPVDGKCSDGENGYQRHLKYERIRNHVRTGTDRVLFDYADILCWSDAGQIQNTTWTDLGGAPRSFPTIHPDNMLDLNGGYAEDGDHIGQRGALRLAKALWWMLARTAGWDGKPESVQVASLELAGVAAE